MHRSTPSIVTGANQKPYAEACSTATPGLCPSAQPAKSQPSQEVTND
jgi:hypothetical protein